ncbi:hypothetical protein SASPL_107136 [Salvia splendens]|uniref:Charged multivesicular body protein 2A n=1 Tax=Salvia splendens TaxID=180675 RepID=A0A8X8YED9_SALSN|nr:hypothetical protein SASPL_107136 [Salvia splendens]
MNIFSKKPTAKEALRESKREMALATRGVEREIQTLQSEEKKLVAEIKRTAKTGNEAATKILARQLIRLRQQITKLQGSRAQMRGISTHTQAMSAQTSVAVGMQGASKAMAAMNKNQLLQMDPAKQMKVMQEFQKQSAQMDMTLMNDIFFQVLDEIGVDVASQLSAAPKGKIAGRNAEEADSSRMDELEKSYFLDERNSKLRRSSREPVPVVAPRENADGFGSMLGRNLCVVVLDRRPLLDTNLLDRPSVASSDELCLLLEMTAALFVELTFRAARPLSISSCCTNHHITTQPS